MLTDRNPECYCADKVERFVELSTFDEQGHVLLARVNSDDLAAVFTAGADPIVTVARAAEAAGCHGIDPEIAEICADKLRTRWSLYDSSLQPGFKKVCDGFRIKTALDEIGLSTDRYIVKGRLASGSRGHTIGTYADFQDVNFGDRAYARAAKYSPDSFVIFERWLDGTILSVETLWYNGVMIPLNAVERPFDGIIELGHYNPLVTDAERRRAGTFSKVT
jgi:hypothetical protein